MKERPILLNDAMVRAILDGKKTQTRRVLNPQAAGRWGLTGVLRCPYGVPGDRLWVREAWGRVEPAPTVLEDGGLPDPKFVASHPTLLAYWRKRVAYRATDPNADVFRVDEDLECVRAWRPSIHMPRWASRLVLEVTDVRVERLCDISEEDARAEGASFHDGGGIGHSGWRHDLRDVHADARSSFARLWDSIYAARGYGWDAAPWVWVVSFRRLDDDARGAA